MSRFSHKSFWTGIGILALVIGFQFQQPIGQASRKLGSWLSLKTTSLFKTASNKQAAGKMAGNSSSEPNTNSALNEVDLSHPTQQKFSPKINQLNHSQDDSLVELDTATLTGKELIERARQIRDLKDRKLQADQFTTLITELTKENWEEAASELLPLCGQVPMGHWFDLMRRIGALGEAQAMNRFKPNDPLIDYDTYHARFAMEGWAKNDQAAALAYVLSLPEGRYRDGMAIGLFRAMTDYSRDGLDGLFNKLNPKLWPEIAAALRDVIRWEPTHKLPPVELWMREAVESEPPDSLKLKAIKQAADLNLLENAVHAKQPEDIQLITTNFFSNHREHSDRVLSTALRNLASYQPENALNTLENTFKNRPQLKENLPHIIRAWSHLDLGGPGDWLNANPQAALYSDILPIYAAELQQESPEAAQKWLHTKKKIP
jgi:hypothetical protein